MNSHEPGNPQPPAAHQPPRRPADLVRRAGEAWRAYWFRPTPLLRLALVRIILVACQVFWFFPSLALQRTLVTGNDAFDEPQAIIRALGAILPEELFRASTLTIDAVWAVTFLAGLFALVGLFTRSAMFVLAMGSTVMVAHAFSYGTRHHPEALFMIVLFLLAFSPCGQALSVDAWRRARRSGQAAPSLATQRAWVSSFAFWPLMMTQWLMAIAYFNAGLCKLHIGGAMWFNGYTMQSYLLDDSVRFDRPLGLWMAQQHELAVLISYGAVGFEVLFPLVLVFRRLLPLFMVAGLSMHLGIFILQAAPFWQFMVLYLAFVPLERAWDRLRRERIATPPLAVDG